MNWEAIAAVGEILGAIAVLITLVYLASQVRQNTASAAAATYDAALSGFNDMNLTIADSEELASIYERGLRDPDSLSELEQVRFGFLMRAGMNQYWKLFRLYQRGALPSGEWTAMIREAAYFVQTPGGARFREDHKSYEEVWAEIDRLGNPAGGVGREIGERVSKGSDGESDTDGS